MNAAQALVQTLVAHGVDRIFCVPGESYLPVLDALYDTPSIQLVSCRHEGGAGLMAVADAKLTRRVGVVCVSRGPGASNAALAMHVAEQDAVPLLVLIGQIERKDLGRGAFQEVDYKKTFGGMCKGVWEVLKGEELAQVCSQAIACATSGIPGPVLISLPEDMLPEDASGPAEPLAAELVPASRDEDIRQTSKLLAQAQRPVMVIGGSITPSDVDLLVKVSEAYQLPVAVGWKHQHLFPNRHPNYAGHLGYNIPAAHLETLKPADAVLALGSRLGDVSTQGYRFPMAPEPTQPLVHVHPAREELGRVYRAKLEVQANCGEFLSRLLKHAPKTQSKERAAWIAHTHSYVEELMRWKELKADDGVAYGTVIEALNRLLPADAIVTHDAGNFSTWMHRYYFFRDQQVLMGAEAGAMGFGVPAAVAASLRYPQRKVVCLVGDGGMLMTGNELATAIMYGAKPLILLSNNGSYGTIRQYQEKTYPGRIMGTRLKNPDFAALGRAFGAKTWVIEKDDTIQDILKSALNTDVACLIEVKSSMVFLSAYARLDPATARA
ncbi:MAG: thiamine pyrophosphate-dependent enzyme [Burkholderiales bacterium]